jgi:hypothetical protein
VAAVPSGLSLTRLTPLIIIIIIIIIIIKEATKLCMEFLFLSIEG